MRRHWFFIPPLAIAFLFLVSAVIMLLWNALLPAIFNFPVISYWQAMGLLILSRILFGGFHPHGPRHRYPFGMRRRWMNMSDEEREKLRHELHDHWCCGSPRSEQPDQTT